MKAVQKESSDLLLYFGRIPKLTTSLEETLNTARLQFLTAVLVNVFDLWDTALRRLVYW